MERAETRLLDRSTLTNEAAGPNRDRAVLDIAVARRFLAARNRAGALRAINDALLADTITASASPAKSTAPLASVQAGPGPTSHYPVAPAPYAQTALAQPVTPPPSPVPVETYRLLPGHWQLRGATYEWVPPETVLRRVAARSLVAGRYEWQGDAWVWVPTHYAN